MSTIEIIHLRSSSEPIECLAERIRESLWHEGRKDGVFTIYRRDGLATDLAVHIRHGEKTAEVPSRIGSAAGRIVGGVRSRGALGVGGNRRRIEPRLTMAVA